VRCLSQKLQLACPNHDHFMKVEWWARRDSNSGPSPCQGDIITARLRAQGGPGGIRIRAMQISLTSSRGPSHAKGVRFQASPPAHRKIVVLKP
jgi:hypothetical protein